MSFSFAISRMARNVAMIVGARVAALGGPGEQLLERRPALQPQHVGDARDRVGDREPVGDHLVRRARAARA